MSSWPLVKYVDSPSTSAVVRCDFNDQAPNPATNPAKKTTEFDPGVPTLEGEPDAVGHQWGFRSPKIVHTIKGPKTQAMAALSAVSREQLRRTNWVMFQPSAATSPVWFKTYRTGYEPVKLDRVYVRVDGGGMAALPDTWEITVPLVADAFAYGPRVTLAPTTVGNNSSAGNPLRVVLPTIKGDAPTRLRVAVNMSAMSTDAPPEAWLTAVIGADSGSVTDTVIDIGTGDVFTPGGGTSAAVVDATYWGGSYRTVTVSAGGGNLLQRLNGTLAAAPPPGRYKVLLRCSADPINSTTPNRYSFSFGQIVNNAAFYGDTVFINTPAANTLTVPFVGWVDLGDFTFPFGGADVPVDVTATAPAPGVLLKVGTPAGVAGTVRVDALKLIPVSGSKVRKATLLNSKLVTGLTTGLSGNSYTGLSLATTDTATWDGDTETMWGAVTASGVLKDGAADHRGGFPEVDPAAAQNVLLCFMLSNLTGAGAVTRTWDVTVSYYPRYLHVGDGT